MEAFLFWLAANAVKGTIVTIIIFLTLHFFARKIPARYRFTLWYLAAIRFVMLPVFFASFSFFTLAPSFTLEESIREFSINEQFHVQQEANMPLASPDFNYSKPEKNWSTLLQKNIPVILFALWAIVSFGLILLFILRNIWGHSLTKGLQPLKDKKINAFIDECRKLVKVKRKLVLHETELTGSPVLLGLFKPKLLVPKGLFTKLKTHELRYIILHELMHLKKNDILINWFFGIICALQWFNPFVWYVFARMKSDREEARDADVLALLNKNESKEYGGLILKLSSLCGSGASFSESVGIMEKNKKITRRIIMIKNFQIMPFRNTVLALALIAGIGVFCLSEAKSKEASSAETKETIKALIKQLSDKDLKVRIKTVSALYTHTKTLSGLRIANDKRATEPLLELLKTVKDSSVRADAASVLARLGDKRGFEAAVALLNDKNKNVRKQTVSTLQIMNDKRAIEPLAKLLKDDDSSVRASAASALASLGDKRAFETAIALLKDKSVYTRIHAASALRTLNDKRAIEPLAKLLKDDNASVRVKAMSALAHLGDKRGFEAAVELLKNKNRSWLSTLKVLNDKRAIEPLWKLLKTEKDSSVRASAAYALARLGDKRAFEVAIALLKDKNKNVRRQAVIALNSLNDKRAIEPLAKLLKDDDSSIRASATFALASLGDKRAFEVAIALLKDKNGYTRSQAASALSTLNDKRAIEPLQELLKTEKNSYAIKKIKKALKKLNKDVVLEKSAISAANSWLLLIDNGKYKESWDEAAEHFKAAISKKQWERAIQTVRKPLGKTLSRKLISKKSYTSLPGAPDGKYTVIQFKSSFENKKSAIETITPMMGKDGKWRVSGYYIK